jgi:hypothetical protein
MQWSSPKNLVANTQTVVVSVLNEDGPVVANPTKG